MQYRLLPTVTGTRVTTRDEHFNETNCGFVSPFLRTGFAGNRGAGFRLSSANTSLRPSSSLDYRRAIHGHCDHRTWRGMATSGPLDLGDDEAIWIGSSDEEPEPFSTPGSSSAPPPMQDPQASAGQLQGLQLA